MNDLTATIPTIAQLRENSLSGVVRHEIERLILVTNNFGNAKISVYAMGHLKPGKTVADLGPARVNIIGGLVAATQPAEPATQPAVAASTTPDKRP